MRQAIQYAVDQEEALRRALLRRCGAPATASWPRPTPGYWKGVEEAYKFSPDKAKGGCSTPRAGRSGAGGIREKGGEKLSLLYITTNRAEYTQAGEVVQDMLKQRSASR